MNVIVRGEFVPNVASTMGAYYFSKEFALKNENKIILDIWDTAGQVKYRSLIKIYILNSDYVVLGYDITQKETYDSIDSFWYPTAKEISGANLYYLIGNKADLYDKEVVSECLAREYAESNNMKFFLISCLKKTGIKEFLDDIIDELIKN